MLKRIYCSIRIKYQTFCVKGVSCKNFLNMTILKIACRLIIKLLIKPVTSIIHRRMTCKRVTKRLLTASIEKNAIERLPVSVNGHCYTYLS